MTQNEDRKMKLITEPFNPHLDKEVGNDAFGFFNPIPPGLWNDVVTLPRSSFEPYNSMKSHVSTRLMQISNDGNSKQKQQIHIL